MPAHADSLTVARLAFWVAPGKESAFRRAYGSRVRPLLEHHGLVESRRRGRATPPGIVARLFELSSPAEVSALEQALRDDRAFADALAGLGRRYGVSAGAGDAASGAPIPFRLELYSARVRLGAAVPAGPGRGHWRTYDAHDGLPEVDITCIAQDREGHLWFGTQHEGACRFDGQTFTHFTTEHGLVHSNWIADAIVDRDGCVWFATRGGACRYDGRTFTTVGQRDGLAGDAVLSLLQDRQGCLWFGTEAGVSRWDGSRFTTFTVRDGMAADLTTSLFQDSRGDLWFGTGEKYVPRGCGVTRYDGHRFTAYTTRDGLPHEQVLCIAEDREGHVWLGTGAGACRYDGRGFHTLTTRDGLAYDVISCVLLDRDGMLWFGTFGGGASRYDGHGFTNFSAQQGLAGACVHRIFEDRDGILWFGTWEDGVSAYDRSTFSTFTAADGLPGDVHLGGLETRDGALWLDSQGGGGAGATRYDGSSFGSFKGQSGVADLVSAPLLEDGDGTLWFGGDYYHHASIARYRHGRLELFTAADGVPEGAVRSLVRDREGHLWIATWGAGICRFDGRRLTTYTSVDGLAGDLVWSAYADRKGDLWFACIGGLTRWDGERFTSYTETDGLPHRDCRAVVEDPKGDLWVVTHGGGICRFDGESFTTYTTADGLASNHVWSVLCDRQGRLWFGTWGGGVSCYNGAVFQTITRQDGLPSSTVWAMLQDRAGRLWFATHSGLTRYTPPEGLPPRVAVDAVVADRRYAPGAGIALPAGGTLVVFEFHGVSLKTRREGMVYRYRLEGHEADWRVTRQRRVEYPGLPAGSYRFQVCAVDRDLVYSEPAEVAFSVVPDPRDARIDELERRVQERTLELEERNRELQLANAALQVEAALERVGAAVAGMQRSADIRNVMTVMWGELRGVGLEFGGCAITIIDEPSNLRTSYNVFDLADSDRWFAQSGAGQRLPRAVGLGVERLVERGLALHVVRSALDADDWARASTERWRHRQARAWVVTQEEVAVHARRLGIAAEDYRTRYFAFVPFAHGELSLATTNPDPEQLSSADLALLQRFAEVFDGGYARFLDFQRLERDRAAEQVRNRVSSMEHAGDLDRVVLQLRDALAALGVGFDSCGLQIMSHEGAAGEAIAVRADGTEVAHSRVEGWARSVSQAWERQEPVYRFDLQEEDRYGEAALLAEGIRSVVDVPFRYGTLALSSRQPKAFWPTDIETLQAFATAISGAYARYLDFQRLEAQNRALERASRFKSDFLARMSHDLRTPMNAIIGYTRILRRRARGALDERQYRNLENIEVSSDHLLALINDILDLSRIEAGRVELHPGQVDVGQLVRECAQSVESLVTAGVELRVQVDGGLEVTTDRDRLRRVVMNILSNAVKFTEAGSIDLSARALDGGVEIAVADTGPGIPAADLPHIFEEFRRVEGEGRARKEGSGLGLSIARKTVELLGGGIAVASEVGRGTTFTVQLPARGQASR